MLSRALLPRIIPALLLMAALATPRWAHAQDAAAPTAGASKATATGAPQSAPGQQSPAAVPVAPRPYVPHTPEELALADVQNQARNAVQALTTAMAGLPDGPDLRALQSRVLQTKRDAEVKFLQIKAQFARTRGDLAAAHLAEDRIESILHPRMPVPVANTRPAPTPDKSEAR